MWDYRARASRTRATFSLSAMIPQPGSKCQAGSVRKPIMRTAQRDDAGGVHSPTTVVPQFQPKKAPSAEQIRSGNISLDCRILDTAPQCEGWHKGTEDGGSDRS
jgi:hypothetical protein